ncbi:FHA domain-containing protein [Plantactinospora soyae]|uniref:PSer/pThr/pTyr-binding forkhead associated (FHA) protein n=1 Tax=Plantactinospora soyae TaxID=1544732 RepID=A0A927M5B2_9ACTN|nr:FHA domain-containing protein [Plantactinospora soyae]MBE1484750.1 pSer/pThr/pTyr-binding forkhead associated (FHA) protein [Plantactinospora soyae]
MSDELDLLPLLTVTSGPLQGASFRLRPGLRQIGREDGVDVLLDDPKVSRRHATVELVDGRVLLTDTGSTNGTWLNDRRLSGLTELHDGDRLRLGHVELRFFDPGAAATYQLTTLRYQALVPPTPAPARAPGPAVSALTAPTQLMGPPQRSRRMLLMIGGCVALAGWVTWAYLAFQ